MLWGPHTCKLFRSSLLSWGLHNQRSCNAVRTVSSLPSDDGVSLVNIGKSLGLWGFRQYSTNKIMLDKQNLHSSVESELSGFVQDCGLVQGWPSNTSQAFFGSDSSSLKYHQIYASLILFCFYIESFWILEQKWEMSFKGSLNKWMA